MSSISTPTQISQTSASAEVERGLIYYLADHLQKSNNLPAVQDGAQCAQLKTRLDVFENRLTDVEGTVIAIQGTVTAIRGTVTAIRDDVKHIRDDVKGIRSDVSNIQQDMTRVRGDVTGFRKDIRVLREDLGREMDSLCVMVLNVDSRSKMSRHDRAKVNMKLKTL
ncbi:hypothetical protein E4U46_007542 [Claviceps purpurea]|nr:hypothetical protein E4U37_007966 [Claviceps purpurea]KAG6284090.1 hypothetical protein E4U46_007542 [Claviceps purpurea]